MPSETEAEKIARRARRDLEAYADEWNTLSEMKKDYELQESRFAAEIVEQDDEIQKLEDITRRIQELESFSLTDEETEAWEKRISKLETLELGYSGDVEPSMLHEISIAAIHPLFKSSLQDWQPLQEPLYLVPYLQRLSSILGLKSPSTDNELTLQNGDSYTKSSSKSTTPYEAMLYQFWLPPVRSAITNDWDPHKPTPLLTLVTAWQPLIPAFIFTSLENLIVQRLTTALEAWQRHRSKRHRSSQQDPDSYIFPWLPFLSPHHTSPTAPTGLLASVRQKLKKILQSHPLDRKPPDLKPWSTILTTHLTNLLTRHLLPRLSSHLRDNLTIDPSDQDLTPLTSVLQWTSLFSAQTSAQLLATSFFPQWHQILHLWLTKSPNYDEIREWFQWWKLQLPITHPLIDAEWTKGLETISLALDLGPERIHELPPPLPLAGANGITSTPTPLPSAQTTERKHEVPLETTFRDVVESFCTTNGLLFLPLREADPSSGQPLFRITGSASGRGGVIVFLRGDVVWARQGRDGPFVPVELGDELVGRAEGA